MGDSTEVLNAMKEHRKTSRRENMDQADGELTLFGEAAEAGGYSLRVMSQHHWNVYSDGKCVVQYWPSANKWQIVKTGKIQHGDRESFRTRLRAGRF